MVFSSIEFLFFFLPAVLVLYYLVTKGGKNWVLLLASLLFYAWGAPDFIFIFIASMLGNFFITRWMHNTSKPKRKKTLLTFSIILNLGILAYFKYMNFFLDNINLLLNLTNHNLISFTKIALPIGISFFTFQSLTYTVDVYRGVSKPLDKWNDYMLYIALFPQLIAGPIIRYNTIAEQLVHRDITMEDRVMGFYRFAIGLGKKVLIANTVAVVADEIFAMDYDLMSSSTAWIGILAYTFQIYFDFSGYSDMAIGLGRMLGFRFTENFNAPYISRSITEFWRRWHITLGAFMKEYLYIPLGGNRVSKARLYFNLGFVFLISGLWHGASWNFVLWGAFHGAFLIMDRAFLLRITERIGKLPAMMLTFFVVALGWVIFRVESLTPALHFYRALFAFRSGTHIDLSTHFIVLFLIAALFAFLPAFPLGNKLLNTVFAEHYSRRTTFVMLAIVLILFILSAGALCVSNFNPFIYFRF